MEWTKTDEKLPQIGWTVWGFWKPETGRSIHAGCVGAVTYGSHGHWHNPDDDEDDYATPTHWMPITMPEGLRWEQVID